MGRESGFVKIKDGKITKFVKRKNISNIASSGILVISSGKDLVNALEKQINSGETINNEYYFGECINYLIKSGYFVYPLPVKAKYDLGNIQGIENFEGKSLPHY